MSNQKLPILETNGVKHATCVFLLPKDDPHIILFCALPRQLSSNLRFYMIPAVFAPVSKLSEHEAKQIRDVSEQEEAEVHLSS
jgi:hypothetical protein